MDEVLKFGIENGMIDLSRIQDQMEMSRRNELLTEHLYKVWPGKNEKWYTYLPDKENGRKLIKKATREAVEDTIVAYWKADMENPMIEEVFDERETDLMVRYLMKNQDIWNLGILLMFVTGIRVGELVALTWDCFHEDAIYIRRTETRYRGESGLYEYAIKEFPKTQAGWRVVAIPQAFQWIREAIRKLHADNGSEFVMSREDGSRLNTNCMRHRMRRVCDNVGIPRRSPHKIRKTYCSILFDSGVNQKLITDQMGHTDIMCSELHYHRNRKDLDTKIKTISAVSEFRQKLALVE